MAELTTEGKVEILWEEREDRIEAKAKEISVWKAALVGMLFTVLTHIIMHYLHW